MSELLRLDLDMQEAKLLYRHLLKLGESAGDDGLDRIRRRLEKELFSRLSITEMETLIRYDESIETGQ